MRSSQKNNSISTSSCLIHTFGKKPFTRCATSLTEHSDSLWKIQNESIWKSLSEESQFFLLSNQNWTLLKVSIWHPFDCMKLHNSGPGPVWCFGWNGVRMTPVDRDYGKRSPMGGRKPTAASGVGLMNFHRFINRCALETKLFEAGMEAQGGKRWMQIWWDSLYTRFIDSHFIHVILLNLKNWGIRDYVSEAKHC